MSSILDGVSHKKISNTGIDACNGDDSHEDEKSSNVECENEFGKMFQVQDETIPGTLAEAVTSNSHISIGEF
jgi:hypothetical protein